MEARTSKRAKEMLCHEIERIVGEGELKGRLADLHMLTDTLKNFYKIEMAKEYGGDGYSHGGTFDDEYDREHSGRRHLVRAHYSYDDGRRDMMGKLDELMRDAPTDKDREAIRRCMNLMQDM